MSGGAHSVRGLNPKPNMYIIHTHSHTHYIAPAAALLQPLLLAYLQQPHQTDPSAGQKTPRNNPSFTASFTTSLPAAAASDRPIRGATVLAPIQDASSKASSIVM